MIRVDSSPEIGYGHVMRCLTLAHELASVAEVVFICVDFPGSLIWKIENDGFRVLRLDDSPPAPGTYITEGEISSYSSWLPWSERVDADYTRAALIEDQTYDCAWLIVDHYALSLVWESALAFLTKSVMVIDDLFDRRHACSLLLNQTPTQQERPYAGLVPDSCRILQGARYALLRPQFSRWREKVLARRNELNAVTNILIAVGGVDQQNISFHLLQAIEQAGLDPGVSITVVLGKSAPHLEQLRQYAATLARKVRIRVDISEIDELMWQADLAIGAAGGTAWERCAMGLPTLVLIYAENQRANAEVLIASGAAKLLDNLVSTQVDEQRVNDWTSTIGTTVQDLPWLHSAAQQAFALCDGQGAQRVAAAIIGT